MALAFIGLGSNQGDGRENLLRAWKELGKVKGVTLLAISSPYRTTPVAVNRHRHLADTPFTNGVGAMNTTLAPQTLLRAMLEIEDRMGRDRDRGPDRIIDLDLLFHDDLCLMTPELVLPHPEISRRLFVLLPLCEITPDHIHPASGKSARQMLRELKTNGQKAERISWEEKNTEEKR